jgi:hypothetical protein
MIQIYRDPHYIEKFAIYGERHSGTKFLQNSIEQCFNINLTSFYGGKHWMGYADHNKIKYDARNVLFFGIVRHPYDWIYAFYNMPHHVPKHIKGNIFSFLSNEWYSINPDKTEIMHDRNFNGGKRYRNIFELRLTKIDYLINTMPIIANNYILITYEYFTKNYSKILDMISDRFKMKKNNVNLKAVIKKPIKIPDVKIKSIIDNNIDWELESTLGYFPR